MLAHTCTQDIETHLYPHIGVDEITQAKIDEFNIPKRSPDLNVCDYALWAEVNKRMRAQERRWPAAKKEARAHFLARLRRTAMNLPQQFVDDAIGDMKRRCKLARSPGEPHPEPSLGRLVVAFVVSRRILLKINVSRTCSPSFSLSV